MTVLMYQMEYVESTYKQFANFRAEIRPWSKVCGSEVSLTRASQSPIPNPQYTVTDLHFYEPVSATVPLTTEDYPTPAKRPPLSVLDTRALHVALSLTPRHWRENLRTVLKAMPRA